MMYAAVDLALAFITQILLIIPQTPFFFLFGLSFTLIIIVLIYNLF